MNPVDYFNFYHVQEGYDLLLSANKTLRLEEDGGYYEEPNAGQRLHVYDKGIVGIKVLDNNALGLIKGLTYSPFQILMRLRFRNNFHAAFCYVGMKYQDMDFPYIRIGIKYFKVIHKNDRFGVQREELAIWSKDEIKTDFGKDMLDRVSKFDAFIIEPSNLNYQKVIDGHYNLYAPFPHEPKKFNLKKAEEKIKWSLILMKHIFQEHLEQGRYLHERLSI